MHNLKLNGDYLAQEFARLVNANTRNEALPAKLASSHEEAGHNDDDADADIAGIMVDLVDDEVDYASDALANDIDDFESYVVDPVEVTRQAHIIAGLNKIASGLRVKGEAFAADVVEAASKYILSDFEKEASMVNHINIELQKIAKELTDKNDDFAADLVYATINNLKA